MSTGETGDPTNRSAATRSHDHAAEVSNGERFEFGRNWERFLAVVDEGRIARAQQALEGLIGSSQGNGRRFLDIGSGSGIVSLAARRLGFDVSSFDYDPRSVACTREIKRRYRPNDPQWLISEGSILDERFVNSLGSYDVVYSWGVLHHTGSMWRAIDLASTRVARSGTFVLAIYNDQGPWSRVWKGLKRVYNGLPGWLRMPYAMLVMLPREAAIAFVPLLKFKPGAYLSLWTDAAADGGRGMSRWYDLIDWIGGYPFEVAKPEDVFEFCKDRGFALEKLSTCAGELGCNQFVFRRTSQT